jgi:hypothetical protein
LSTQQILGVVGGVVGAFFGYPQLGFVVGSLVGGLLTPGEKTEGPRVDDLKVQVSTYGAGIARLRGTERVGGNVVWSTNKIETESTETQGKGGAPEHTTYRYFVHMGIVLCETPRDGSTVSIVQIFQDGKLIYDARSGIPIGSALASAENPHAFFVLYQGHADQLPDPIEELQEGGPGSVPAYRGVVRIRMNAVECPGGRVPQFSFVLSTTASTLVEKMPFVAFPRGSAAFVQSDGIWHFNVVNNGPGVAQTMEVFYGTSSGTATLIRNVALTIDTVEGAPSPVTGAERPQIARGIETFVGLNQRNRVEIIDMEEGNVVTVIDRTVPISDGSIGISNPLSAAYDPVSGAYAFIGGAYGGSGDDFTHCVLIHGVNDIVSEPLPATQARIAFYDALIYAVYYNAPNYAVAVIDGGTGEITQTFLGPGPFGVSGSQGAMIQANEDGVYVWIQTGTLGETAQIHKIDPVLGTWTLLCADAQPSVGPKETNYPGTFYCTNRSAIVGPSSSPTITYDLIRFGAVALAPVEVSTMVAELCEGAGETRYDVSGIPDSDTLHGYKLQNPASARSDIDPLLTAFAIYIVDEDGVIKFKKYEEISTEATIAYDELGQAEDGSEPADAMPLNRAQEIDMPRSVAVSYIDPSFDYQTASEKAVRQITEATEDLIIELPMATNSDHAKKVAEMVMFAKWRSQNTRSFKTSRKYAFLSPGDGVTVEYPRGTFRLWRITSMTDTGVLCEFNVEPGDAELYTQTAVGATGYVGQQVTPLAPPTRMVIGDWAMVRDADNSAGPYVAMEGYSSAGWTGAELLIGDDDTNLQSRGTVSNSAAIGFAETVLGAWALNVVDETNLLTVNVGEDELSSITREVLLAGTENVFALGVKGRWEIAQFQRADDLGDGRFILSGLRRGLRGTEYAAGLHEAGDVFVILSIAGTLKPSMEVGAIGQTKSYRAVSKGRSPDSVASISYAGNGEPLRPFSPVDIRKSFSGNDIVFTWHRRTRFSENVLAGIFPLGEVSERYVLELCTDSTFEAVIRTLTVTSETATYTEAMQDFDGYVSGPLYARVYQVSDAVGLGHELEATL